MRSRRCGGRDGGLGVATAPPAVRFRTPPVLLVALLAVALCAAVPATADEHVAWTRAALWGGDVRSLAFHPGDPDRVFAGTSSGHVYRSDDGGESWVDAGPQRPLPGWVVSDLLFDPDVDTAPAADGSLPPGRLWAALWGTWGGGMVVVSDDGGRSWRVRGRDDLGHTQVYALARVPGRPGHLYAGTLSGVWGSTDGGESWRRLTAQLPEVHKVTSLLVGPGDPDRVLAGTWERVWRSDDGGRTWYGVFDGMILDSEVFTLTPVPGRPDEIWASTCGWVYRTGDAGGRWQRFTEGFEQRRTPAFDVLPGGRLLAGTVEGLHLSDDGGRTWRRSGPSEIAVHDLAHHPSRPRRVLVATEGSGVWVSDDGGETLRRAATGMRNVRVAALVRAGGEVLAAVNHAGPASGVHASQDGGRTFAAESVELPAVRDLAVHGVSVYAATERGLWERSGGSWRLIGELGRVRVEELVSDGGRLLVRTADGLWEHRGPRFSRLDYHHGPPRSAAVAPDVAWVADAAGLYRLTATSNDTVEVPFAGGRVARFGSRLVWWGEKGVAVRPAEGEPWVRLTGGPARLLRTGDRELPALILQHDAEGGSASLLDPESGALQPVPGFPLPVDEIASALLHRDRSGSGRLLLGTSGHGLYLHPLADRGKPGGGDGER